MIAPDPMMSDALYERVLDFTLNDNTTITADELMTEYYDEISDAVLTMVETYGGTPQWVIEEFIVDGEFPTDPNQVVQNEYD